MQGGYCAIILGDPLKIFFRWRRDPRNIAIIDQVGELDPPAYRVVRSAGDKIIIGFAGSPGHGVEGGKHGFGKPLAPQPLER
jgi:hypothetical protein